MRSIRCRVGVRMGSSATQSATEPQAEWPDGAGLSLPESNLTQGPASSPDAQTPQARNPFPADEGQDTGHFRAGHHCLQPNSSAQPWPMASAVIVPFQGLWPSPSRRETVHLANKALGSKFFQPRSQMQVTDILCGWCETLILNSELVSIL